MRSLGTQNKLGLSDTDKGAYFSPDRKHRFMLWRKLGKGPGIMFIGLNPSTANEVNDDPTVRRCMGYARDWGYGDFWMCNLYSLCSSDPKKLYKGEHPQSPYNITSLGVVREKVDLAIVAWGNHGATVQMDQHWPRSLVKLLSPVHCFGVTKQGEPKHPLYLPKDAEIVPFRYGE